MFSQPELQVHLERKGNIAKINSHRDYRDLSEYLSKAIDLFSATNIHRNLWLTDTEKRFFIATVILVLNGIDNYSSSEAIQIYEKYFLPKINKRVILDRLNKLSKKNWVKYQVRKNKKIIIPPFFENIGLKKDVMDFKVRIDYEQNTINRRDMGEDIPIEPHSRK